MPAAPRKPKLFVDTHVRVAAWLHIALAVLTLGLVGFAALGLAAFSQWGRTDISLLKIVGGTVLLGLGLFPLIEIVGAAKLLDGKPSGRIITMVFSVIHVLNFPVGTAVCVYSFWVLLRDPPKKTHAAVPAGVRTMATDARPLPSSTNADLAAAIDARRSALAVARSRVAAEKGAATSAPPRTDAGARPAVTGQGVTPAGPRPAASIAARPRTTRPS